MEREELLAAALAEYLDCAGAVDIESFCRRYPALEPDLRTQLTTLDEIGRVAGPEPALPARLSGHRILSQIGAGGMGRVFLALDEALGRQVAIKTLDPRLAGDAGLRARFMQEARAMARLAHPNVARIYNLGPPEEPPHFVMEYVEGAPLTEAARPLEMAQKAELMHKVTRAVEFLHRSGVLHRDLKPANILVGPDLEPKLLDFGLALDIDDQRRLTQTGVAVGTPDYFSPEQARAEPLDARSDVFSLGTVLFELLTGVLPFTGRSIAEDDPPLPGRLNAAVPAALQNICLKALEKDPAQRYASAREMAADLERYLAGEPVLAAPTSYVRLMAGRIERHVGELEAWRRDRILSDEEYDGLRQRYDRLIDREDAWILEARRLSLPQVSLYLGVWLLAVGAALLVLFRYAGLGGAAAVLVAAAPGALTAWIGLRCWRAGQMRIGVAYLLAFCLLLPLALLVAMGEYRLFVAPTRGQPALELFSKLPSFKPTSNAQLWWSLLLSLPAYLWLRRFTGSTVFSLVFSGMAALFSLATLLRMGLIDWLDNDPGRPYFYLLPCAALFLIAGMVLERRRHPGDSRYFYPVAVLFTIAGLSGVVTFHEPYSKWLAAAAPWTRGQLEYLFILNAAAYFLLQWGCERLSSAQIRMVAKSFRFVIPGHVMTSLLLLGLAATSRWESEPARASLRFEARLFEIVLPVVACLFVFASIPKQMKNFFASGLVFLAAGLVRLEQDLFKGRALWPVALLAAGLALMLAAANYARLVRRLTVRFRSR